MDEVARLIVSVALAGVALTLLGGGVIWSMDESRRVRRSLKKVLGEAPHNLLIAPGRGRGVGTNFTTGHVAVTWDAGAWCLVYRLEELIGAELVIDGRVEARAQRGQERRPLDRVDAGRQVRLRLVFDDPRHPDFLLDLWLEGDEGRKAGGPPDEAVQEANRWLALVDSVIRRSMLKRQPGPPRPSTARGSAPEPTVASPQPPLTEPDDEPPWDEDEADTEPVD
jgi:hypothetical protein